MNQDDKPSGSLADQAANWVPPWARPKPEPQPQSFPDLQWQSDSDEEPTPEEPPAAESPSDPAAADRVSADAPDDDTTPTDADDEQAHTPSPVADQPTADADERVAQEPPATDEPTVDESPTVDEPVAEEPTTVDEPAADQSTTANEPAAQEPTTVNELAAQEPTTVDEAAVEQSTTVDEPAVEQSAIVDQPAAGEPTAEEPATVDESAAEEGPGAEVPGAEGFGAEGFAAEEPIVEGVEAEGGDARGGVAEDSVVAQALPGMEPTTVGDGPGAEPAPAPEMTDSELRGAVEAILLVVDEPTSEVTLAQVLEQPVDRVLAALEAASAQYSRLGFGFDLRRVAGGWRLYTRPEYAAYVEKFVLDGQQIRLTQAALETLAVIAYKQPVTRSRISAIRGVNCDGVVRTLVTRGLIEETGSEPESGAFLYRTTTLFLEKLGLDSVDQLPPLAPFLPDDIDEIADAQR